MTTTKERIIYWLIILGCIALVAYRNDGVVAKATCAYHAKSLTEYWDCHANYDTWFTQGIKKCMIVCGDK